MVSQFIPLATLSATSYSEESYIFQTIAFETITNLDNEYFATTKEHTVGLRNIALTGSDYPDQCWNTSKIVILPQSICGIKSQYERWTKHQGKTSIQSDYEMDANRAQAKCYTEK